LGKYKNNYVFRIIGQNILNGVGKIYYTKSIDNGNTFLPPDKLLLILDLNPKLNLIQKMDIYM